MADVVTIAKDRRAALTAEIAKLDEFIRMAEALLKYDLQRQTRSATVAESTALKALPASTEAAVPAIRDDAKERESTVNAAAEKNTESAKVISAVRRIFTWQDHAQSAPATPADNRPDLDTDHFTFNDTSPAKEPVKEEALELSYPAPKDAALADVHVGQQLRKRRWMIGMSREQLGEAIGVKTEQIQLYEAGSVHISNRHLWDIAAVMKVPMSYFYEDIDGQAPDTAETRSDILDEKEALAVVGEVPRARSA